jgi:uncharacterized Zn-binding protein involved in type VI secretion
MQPAARVTDYHICPGVEPGPVPHVGGAILPSCAPQVLTGNQPQARLSDQALCVGPLDVVAGGAATVLVHGLPAARIGDSMAHGGKIVKGLPTVLIGGPSFELPPNIKLIGTPFFQQQTLRDLFFLSQTPTGAEMLRQIEASGKQININQTAGKGNACTAFNDYDATHPSLGSGSNIGYNPEYRTNVYDKDGNMIAEPPQVTLGHEMMHAMHNANGTQAPEEADPNPPKSEPDIDREEAQTIGTGSYDGSKSPTENNLRKDLNLPRRDNHGGTMGPAPGEPKPLDLRPGEPYL